MLQAVWSLCLGHQGFGSGRRQNSLCQQTVSATSCGLRLIWWPPRGKPEWTRTSRRRGWSPSSPCQEHRCHRFLRQEPPGGESKSPDPKNFDEVCSCMFEASGSQLLLGAMKHRLGLGPSGAVWSALLASSTVGRSNRDGLYRAAFKARPRLKSTWAVVARRRDSSCGGRRCPA